MKPLQSPRHSRLWKFLTASALGLAVVIALVCGCRARLASDSSQMASVESGDVVVSVIGQGKVESEFNLSVTPPRAWGLKIATLAAEGTRVSKGDVIITLDTSDLDKRLSEDVADEKAGIALLENARENLKVIGERVRANVEKAQANFQIANLQWETVRAGYTEAAVTKARLLVAKAAEQAEHARSEMESWRTLTDKGAASKTDFDARELEYRKDKIQLEEYKVQLALLEAGSTPVALKQARLKLDLAQIDLDAANDQASFEIARANQQLLKAQAVLKLRRQEREKAERLISQCSMTAPVDGTLFYENVNTHEGVEKVREGMEVRPWQRLVRLPDISHLLIRVKVDETRIAAIHPGQPAAVTLESMRGESFVGKVKYIDPVARSQSESRPSQEDNRREEAATKVFDVLVAFDTPDPRIAPGLSGEAEIVSAKLARALLLPVHAIYHRAGETVVYVSDNGSIRPLPVKLGPEIEGRVVIEQGLSAGASVFLRLPSDFHPEETP